MAIPRLLIDPPVTFTPSPYGLMSVAQPATPATPHWQNGVTYRANCLTTFTTYDECISVTGTGSPPPPETKSIDTDGLICRGATPFTVYSRFSCSPVGYDDLQAIAKQSLAEMYQWQVERALWTGTAGAQQVVWPHLAANAVQLDVDGCLLQSLPTTGTASDPATVLGYLEAQVADCYMGRGVIHIPRTALPTFDGWGLLRQSGGKLQTIGGSLVVAGDGYPGTAPDGSEPAAGQAWIYATGALFEMHGDVRVTELRDSFDRAENTLTYMAEQTFLFGWDCCHFGRPVLLGVPRSCACA